MSTQFTILSNAIVGARHVAPAITWKLSDGSKLDLTAATITGNYQKQDSATATGITGTLTPDADQVTNTGLFTWTYSAADVDTAGDYIVQFIATFTNAAKSLPALWSVLTDVPVVAFPFSYDESLRTDRDYLRLLLGDTVVNAGPQPNGKNFSDKEMDTFLTKAGSEINGAYILICRILATHWTSFALTQVSKVGRMSAEQVADQWKKRAHEAMKVPITEASGKKPFIFKAVV